MRRKYLRHYDRQRRARFLGCRRAGSAGAAIAWPGGGSTSVPLISQADALHGLQQPIAKACPRCTDAPLRITTVALGFVNAVSSRGPTQIPAWIFSFAG